MLTARTYANTANEKINVRGVREKLAKFALILRKQYG